MVYLSWYGLTKHTNIFNWGLLETRSGLMSFLSCRRKECRNQVVIPKSEASYVPALHISMDDRERGLSSQQKPDHTVLEKETIKMTQLSGKVYFFITRCKSDATGLSLRTDPLNPAGVCSAGHKYWQLPFILSDPLGYGTTSVPTLPAVRTTTARSAWPAASQGLRSNKPPGFQGSMNASLIQLHLLGDRERGRGIH